MRNYELAYIAHPELDDEKLEELEGRVKGWIENSGGKIDTIDRWGKRKLAYPINKQTDGYYFFVQVELPPQGGALIERDLRLSEQILRFLITSNEAV
jgi:small subunit ribosomal protein S6